VTCRKKYAPCMAMSTARQKRSKSCAATMEDMLHAAPDAKRWAELPVVEGVGVYVDRCKFFVKYTQRRMYGKQAQVRHGMFDSHDVACVMVRWLGAQDEGVRLTPGAARAFLTCLLAEDAAKKNLLSKRDGVPPEDCARARNLV